MPKIAFDFQVDGIEAMIKNLERFERTAVKAVAAAIYAEAQSVMEQSQRMCPVDTSWLVNSNYVTKPVVIGRSPEVEFGYAAEYAEEVHEKIGATFQKAGARAKFLAIPLNRAKRKLLRKIGKRAWRDIQRGRARLVPGQAPNRPRNRGANPNPGTGK
jgi:hypothetical protein